VRLLSVVRLKLNDHCLVPTPHTTWMTIIRLFLTPLPKPGILQHRISQTTMVTLYSKYVCLACVHSVTDGHFSTTSYPGALMSTYFDGNAIYIFGSVDIDYGMLSVTIDGNATTLVNCTATSFRPQTLLVGGMLHNMSKILTLSFSSTPMTSFPEDIS
jgi:hypothetical protein